MNREWELRAVCRSMDTEVFFKASKRNEALAACGSCPVSAECLRTVLGCEEGLSAGYRDGIFAGLGPGERAVLGRSRGEAKRPVKRTRGPGQQLAECGTRAAYQRHQRKGEPIDQACREANARGAVAHRATGSTQVPASR